MATSSEIEFVNMMKLNQMRAFEPSDVCDEDGLEEEAATQFDFEFYKNMWYSRSDVIVEGIPNESTLPDGTDTIIKKAQFKIDSGNYDILSETQIIFPFPSVKVKDKFRTNSQDAKIAWTPFALINNIIEVTLKYGDTTYIDPFDNIWLMNHLIWNTPEGDMNAVNYSIGNRPSMLEWNHSIPAQTCYHRIPFGYSYSPGSALPLYLFGSQVSLTHVVTYYKNPVEKLLMMKITDDGDNWTHIPSSLEMLEISECLAPTLELSYNKILPKEKEKIMERDVINIPMHTVVSFSGKNRNRIGNADTVELVTSHSVLGIFVVSRNIGAEELNIRSNYTNNIFDPTQGGSPISSFYMDYDTVKKFDKTADIMRSDKMLRHFVNVPKQAGYLAYPYSVRPFSTRYMVGPVLNSTMKASLTVHYGGVMNKPKSESYQDDSSETDLIKKILERKSRGELSQDRHIGVADNNTYITEVRALIFRDLKFIKDKDGKFVFNFN